MTKKRTILDLEQKSLIRRVPIYKTI